MGPHFDVMLTMEIFLEYNMIWRARTAELSVKCTGQCVLHPMSDVQMCILFTYVSHRGSISTVISDSVRSFLFQFDVLSSLYHFTNVCM